ncbi:DNA mismatch repair protein Msh6 [Apostichopus japonicus]|uniref:DNA mismatch repair protein Msh6 n=1 Tax=Stichopus japonicus TaxID=307972 RepID=A0A2G8JMU3_STIJA|nr:DNA mismatch repair protein Msh6 [Apostichopus japonicus]
MKEKATLFSFFSKLSSKKSTSPEVADDAGVKKSVSPKESAKTSPKLTTETTQEKLKLVTKPKAAACKFNEFEVVWAKLDGYPWWPSLVCNHPTLKSSIKE